jgi:hypothetical protein
MTATPPLVAAAAARIGLQALCLGRSTPQARTDQLRDRAARQLTLAKGGLTDEWRPTYHGVQLALAEAYAARFAGQSAVAQFREATALAKPFGAYFGLEARLNLAAELLAHGSRDEGRELLVECWDVAHGMGAHDLERRALKLATRTRVPLPESARGQGAPEPADASGTRGPRPPRHRSHQQGDRDRPVHVTPAGVGARSSPAGVSPGVRVLG